METLLLDEYYKFKGWNDEDVFGYLVKPVDFDASKKVIARHLRPESRVIFLGDYVDRGPQSLENINYQVGDYQIELVWVDSQSDPEKATRAYEEAIVQDGIQAGVLNWHSSVAVSAMAPCPANASSNSGVRVLVKVNYA